MVKKRLFAVIAAVAVMVVLGACGSNGTVANITEESTVSEEENVIKSETAQIEENDTETTEAVIDQADENNTMQENDFDIESYQSLQSFSYNLFAEKTDAKNPVLSPTSAYLALTMAGLGADGNTRTEFDHVLGEDMMALSGNLMNTLPVESDYQILSLANSAWIDDQYIVDEKWISSIKSVLSAEEFQDNLSSTDAMNRMNSWIDEKTKSLIKKMIAKPLPERTRLVLFNTIYFKGKWCNPFEMDLTYTDTFHVSDTEQVETAMMHKSSEYFDYVSNDFAEGLIFPYLSDTAEHNLALIALKPREDMDVRELYQNLNSDVVSEMISDQQTVMVNTMLPKFEIAFEADLNDNLINMGLVDGFDPDKADFTLMGRNESENNLYIGLVKQKAKIIVDEEGTEAAAATEVAMIESCALIEEEPIDVFFDEPFLYMIMDMDREIPLFMGILDNPAETND